MKLSALLVLGWIIGVLGAQTSVYLRGGSPPTVQIIAPGCTNVTPMVCTVESTSGFSIDDAISVAGVCATDGLNNVSAANGLRKVKARTTTVPFTITLKDLSNVDVAGNGVWCTGATATATQAIQTISKVTAFNLVDHPRVWFDGPTGDITRRYSLGTDNGLDNTNGIVVVSNVATVTTTYDLTTTSVPLATGMTVSVWNTNNSTLTPANTGREFNVTVTSPTTFTFPITLANGNYTHNDVCGPGASPNGTIQGTENCVRISQMAVSTNPWWVGILFYTTAFPPSSNVYKSVYRGGTQQGTGVVSFLSIYSISFFVDQLRQDLLSAAIDTITHIETLNGTNFIANEEAKDGGNIALGQDPNPPWLQGLANSYSLGIRRYMTSVERQTFMAKMGNDIYDATPCSKTNNVQVPIAVVSGTATGGSSTTITLDSGASGTDSFYVNNVAQFLHTGTKAYGLITGYVGATKVATVVGWNTGSPVSGDTYDIWETHSRVGTALTGYNTHWNSAGPDQLHAGDYLIGLTPWFEAMYPGQIGSYVTAVNSDTSLTVINGDSVTSTSTPSMTYISHPWGTGDCGYPWVQNHWQASVGVQPVQYPPQAGEVNRNPDGTAGIGGNNGYSLAGNYMSWWMAAADDDSRAAANIARYSNIPVDNYITYSLGISTGITQSGTNYGLSVTSIGLARMLWMLSKQVVGYPSLDTAGPSIQGVQSMKMYTLHPDSPFYMTGGHVKFFSLFGSNTSNYFPNTLNTAAIANDHGIAFNPLVTNSKYTKYFLDNVLGLNNYSSAGSGDVVEMSIKLHPASPSLNYNVLPTQYLFRDTSYATAVSSFGYPFPSTWHMDAFVSRTGWNSASDTHLWFRASPFIGDHDVRQPGDLQLYKAGWLLANDIVVSGDGPNESIQPATTHEPILELTGANTLKPGYGTIGVSGAALANITKWSGSNPYGDSSSRYACALSTVAGAYTTTLTRAEKTVCDLKATGMIQTLVTFMDVASPSPIQIRDQWFYTQSGQTTAAVPEVIYNEGDTSCPGLGGCGAVNTNREVLEQEDGLSSNGDPLRQYNLNSHFFSPGTIALNWDGTGYPNSAGNAYRLSIYGGSSVGGTATSLESVASHCILTQPATTCASTGLNPDSSWTGVNTPDTVALFARGGSTHTSMTAVSVTLANPGRVIISGLTAGSYTLTVGAFNCGTLVVAAGDNTAYCETSGSITGGVLSLNGAAPTSSGLFPLPVPVKR